MILFQGILFMITVGLCWTSFGIIMGRAPERGVDVGIMLFFSSIVAIAVCGTLGMIEGFPAGCPAPALWLTFGALFVCGILNYVQLDLMSRAMKHGPNGIVWSLIQASFLFPFIGGVVFFGARCSFWNLSGAALVIVALLILGLSRCNSGGGRWKWPAFLSFLTTGIAQMLSNLPSYYPEAEAISSIWRSAFFAFGLGGGTVLGTLWTLRKKLAAKLKLNLKNRSMWTYCFVLQGFEIIASIFLLYPGMNLLAEAGAGAIAYPLVVASGIVGFEFYALLFLRERRNAPQLAALILTLLGIAALCG